MTSTTRSLTPSAPALGVGVQAAHSLPNLPSRHSALVGEALARAGQPGYFGWLDHVRAAAGCTRPVRLVGAAAAINAATGELRSHIDTAVMPDGAIYKGCGNRRASVCPACAETYRRDAYQILRCGLVGGKDVPDSVATHDAAFVTFTAPSFGPVHTRVVKKHICSDKRHCQCRPDPCRARSGNPVCDHGVPMACFTRHDLADELLGTPICVDCYDHEHQVIWNLFAGELWRRTKQTAERHLGSSVRIAHGKAAEFQVRGAVHFHALLRLDGYDKNRREEILPPPPWVTAGDLEAAIRHAATHTRFNTPAHPQHLDKHGNSTGWDIAWGGQLDVRMLTVRGSGEVTDQMAAAYLAKYATKSTEVTGHRSTRITTDNIDVYADPAGSHTERLIDACWRLGGPVTGPGTHERWTCATCHHATRFPTCPTCRTYEPAPPAPGTDTYVSKPALPVPAEFARLRRWAHMLGFGGHFLTKARRYSVTFKILRDARAAWRRNDDQADAPDTRIVTADHLEEETTLIVGGLTFAGVGWRTNGDALLANTAAARAREYAATAREELAHEIGSQVIDHAVSAA